MNRREKILFLTNDFPPAEGGMETCAFELSRQFAEYFDQLTIVANPSTAENIENNNIIRLTVSRNFFLKFLKLFFYLLRVFLNFKPDYIYLNTWSPFGLPVFILSKIFGKKYYITCHGLDIVEPLKSGFHSKCMNLVLNGATKIFCVSAYTRELVPAKLKHTNSSKIIIINNGINLEKFYPADTEAAKDKLGLNNNFVLLTVSRLTPRKGHIKVIECLPELIKSIPQIKYVIAGRGENEIRIIEKIRELDVENYVKLEGFVEDSRLVDYYNACDIFIMLSSEIIETGDIEGFGVSYLEANACAKTVIAAPSGGVCDAVKNRVNGYLCNTENEAIETIKFLYNDKNKLTETGLNAREYVEKKFSWPLISKQYYREITDETF